MIKFFNEVYIFIFEYNYSKKSEYLKLKIVYLP